MLPRVAGAAPPPRKPRRSGGSFHLVYFYPALPGRFFSACPPSPPAALPTPPHPTQGFALWRGRSGRGKKRSRGRRELGGMGGHSGRGACAGKRPGKAGRRGLCVAAAAARCRPGCCPRRPILGGGARGACPPRAAREQPRPPPPANSGPSPMATNQSEAGWAGSRERLLLRRGWRPGAARTVSRCSSLTVSLTPARRNPAPWPAHSPEEGRWSPGVPGRSGPSVLAHSRLSRADPRRPSRPPPGTHTPPASSRPERVAREGAGAGRTDARAPTGRLRAGGEAGGGDSAWVEVESPQLRASPGRQIAGSCRDLAGAAPGLRFSVGPAGSLRDPGPPGALLFWDLLPSRWGCGHGDLIFGGSPAYLSATVMGGTFGVPI